MMNEVKNSEVLVPNPNAFVVRVGQVVHCSYSGREIRVAKKDSNGCVWEQVEPTHPAYTGPEQLRYVGMSYREFEPMCIAKSKLVALFTHPAPELGYL
jgi:hypothetical protein